MMTYASTVYALKATVKWELMVVCWLILFWHILPFRCGNQINFPKNVLKTYLLEDEGSGATREPFAVEVVQTTVDNRQVTGPHVLTGIHSESSHTHVNQLVHEVGHLAPDVIFLQGEVQQTDQTTVTHLEQQISIYIAIKL